MAALSGTALLRRRRADEDRRGGMREAWYAASYFPFGGWTRVWSGRSAWRLRAWLPGLPFGLFEASGGSPDALAGVPGPPGSAKKAAFDRPVRGPAGDDRPLALVRLALLPAFDRHREIDAGDLLIIAELGLGGLLRAADPPRLVDLDLEIGVGVEPIDELVAVLLRDLELVGERSVEIVAAEILNLAAVGPRGEQRTFDQRRVGQLPRVVGGHFLGVLAALERIDLPRAVPVIGLDDVEALNAEVDDGSRRRRPIAPARILVGQLEVAWSRSFGLRR